jgi:hypothetical protein
MELMTRNGTLRKDVGKKTAVRRFGTERRGQIHEVARGISQTAFHFTVSLNVRGSSGNHPQDTELG